MKRRCETVAEVRVVVGSSDVGVDPPFSMTLVKNLMVLNPFLLNFAISDQRSEK